MPTITDLRVSLSPADICRSGLFGSEGPTLPSMLERTADALELIEAGHWFEPAISYELEPVVSKATGVMTIRDGRRIHSQLLSHHLSNATHLAFGVFTLGARFATELRKQFSAVKPITGLIIDTLGTLAVYRLGELWEETVREEADGMRLQASGILAPGEDGFELDEQGIVLQLAGGADIGVSMTGGAMLSPEKSMTAIIGLGRRMRHWTRAENCSRCKARNRCPFRHVAKEGVPS